MKKPLFPILTLAATALCACGGGGNVPSDKTIIRVYGYAGGYGGQWIKNVCERFAEAEKETSYEEGKKGVHFIYVLDKNYPVMASDIKPTEYDVFFTEDSKVNEWAQADCFEDITDVVTGTNKYESGKTIESKMSDVQKDVYKVDGKYLYLPTYYGQYGMIYNKDIFESKNLYFNAEGGFIASPAEPKSVGPDGVANTFDDGLPVTTEDFLALCDKISYSNIPLLFSGQYHQYAVNWMYNMAATIDGADVTQARYDFAETKNLEVAKIVDGVATGEFETVDVNAQNGYEYFRSRGFYEAFKFLDQLVTIGSGKFLDKVNCFDTTVSQIDAQTYFLKAKSGKQAAMLGEGVWWRNEVRDMMKQLPGTEKINFGWMPLPRLPGQTTTVDLDAMHTSAFIRKDGQGKRSQGTLNAVKDLLRFAYTDESLVDFSVETNTFFNLNYDLGDRLNELNSYGKDLYAYKTSENTVVLPAMSSSSYYKRNETKLVPNFGNLKFTDGSQQNPVDYYYNNKKYDRHAEKAFALFADKYSSDWWVK
ncbi:MAG: extracellular solute-binding protein [Bacilli bacterium]|nr:extracellular solute-binding protein [Bacilli bacterium]